MITKHTLRVYLLAISMIFGFYDANASRNQSSAGKDTIKLNGRWGFQTDRDDEGIKQKWYNKLLQSHIHLPGSMTGNNLGDEITVNTPWTGSIEDSSWFYKPQYAQYRQPGHIKVPFWLQPEKYYKGVAWYQKTIQIPAQWKGKPLELFIERAHWTTTVYLDDQYIGTRNSLGTAHQYLVLKGITSGTHTLTIRVDNRVGDINVGQNSHSISDHTQGNWNGMIGNLYLTARPRNLISDVQLFPDIEKKQVVARVVIEKRAINTCSLQLSVQTEAGAQKVLLPAVIQKITAGAGHDTVMITYPMGKHPQLWSEHHPALYKMAVILKTGNEQDRKNILFGMRRFSESGTQFTINGHPTMLRGTLDCAAFPLTGYPPTDVNSWLRILNTCRSFGLNHIRFHSWCPPEAAFEAGDRLGFYFQIECSSWANQGAVIGDGEPLDKYIYQESESITRAYGNHPSFCMMAYGNEPAGKHLTEYLTNFVKIWEKKDPRRLYTTGSGWPIVPQANYNSTPEPRIQHWEEGLKSIINSKKPSTDYDWSGIISKWQHPTVSHEIGQWCAYPDFAEIAQYKGVYKAHNFEIFHDQLVKNGLGDYAERFLDASGKLQILCYKADIEAALRTKGFGGFQLLGLEDFPGQGTALVGVLNAFYRPKPYVNAGLFNQFCNDVVPLARFPKMVYSNNERLEIPVEVAQFSEHILKNIKAGWKIEDAAGKIMFSGNFAVRNIPEGNGILLGKVNHDLKQVGQAQELTFIVNAGKYINSWHFFVYPVLQNPASPENVMITDRLSPEILRALQQGSSVLLSLKKGSLKPQYGGGIGIGFSSIFWNTAWTKGQLPETLGILCQPQHPALKYFPTQSHSDYQWWDAMSHSSPIMLDSIGKGIIPLVRVVDDWVKARSLGLLFEGRVGKGKLLVSGIDFFNDMNERPEAKQLLYSLKVYMGSAKFAPKPELDPTKILSLYN